MLKGLDFEPPFKIETLGFQMFQKQNGGQNGWGTSSFVICGTQVLKSPSRELFRYTNDIDLLSVVSSKKQAGTKSFPSLARTSKGAV